jgi:protein gp37
MSDRSAIEWTEATWNPVTGCTQVSPGCAHCYAKTFAERFRGVPGHPYEQGFDLTLRPERLEQPLLWKKPRLIFVNSMSDLFHEDVPEEFIRQVLKVMQQAHWHTFQLLTKRSERLAAMADSLPWPPNLWMGVSVENQRWTSRIDDLRSVDAAVRFLSCEPLLMNPEWVRSIRTQCEGSNVPFFFKQWGAYDEAGIRRGKGESGRLLDGQAWDGMPRYGRKLSIVPGG